MTATNVKMTGSTTHGGGPLVDTAVKKIRSELSRSTPTGNSETTATSPPAPAGRRRGVYRPSSRAGTPPIPRKDASSTMLLKYDRCRTFEPSQRISANSSRSMGATGDDRPDAR